MSGSRFGDGSKVVDQVSLCHTDPGVNDGQGVVIFVGDDRDLHRFLRVQHRRVRQTLVTDLV